MKIFTLEANHAILYCHIWINSNQFLRQVQSIADAALTEQNELISGRQRARGAQNGRYGGAGGYTGMFYIC